MIKPMLGLSLTALIFSACTKDHDPLPTAKTITIENVLDSKPLVESGTFKGDGTAADQFPGAGITQFNLAGTPLNENKAIGPVPNPNKFTTLPAIHNIVKVTLQ